MKETWVLATGNQHKLTEIREMFQEMPIQILSLKDVNLDGLEIVEDGQTFEENALIKAKTVMKRTGYPAIADDSGLEVDALDKQPGIYSARFAGEDATDEENNRKLLGLLEGIPHEKRTGRFVCAIAVAFPDGRNLIFRGECEGFIDTASKGDSGFGYDPLFLDPTYGLTFGQLGAELKNQISHRSRALKKLKEGLMNMSEE